MNDQAANAWRWPAAQVQEVAFVDTRYRLWLAPPEGAAPAGGWPVLWVLDGARNFGLALDTVRRLSGRWDATGVRPMIVVGLDRAEPAPPGRFEDYTSGPPQPLEHAPAFGGARAFLNGLMGPCRDTVGRAYPETGPNFLLGHSLGGYFALETMAHHPDAFAAVGALSPSIWWNEPALSHALTCMPDAGQCAFIAVGEREEPLSPATPEEVKRAARRMVSRASTAADQVRARLGHERTAFWNAPDEDHGSIVPSVLPRFLRFATRNLD